jgi:glycine betaine/proline transport system permease protein
MSFFTKFPAMERGDLRDLKKGIDSSFKEFSRSWGESIEAFF